MRLEHLLSGDSARIAVWVRKLDKRVVSLLSSSFIESDTLRCKKCGGGIRGAQALSAVLSASPIAQLVRAPH